MKALICVHHLHAWAGSELVTIELFEELLRQGIEAKVFCPFPRPTFTQRAVGDWRSVVQDPKKINLTDYDLVLVLHQSAARFLHLQTEDSLFGEKRPFWVFLHLSPYEQFEAPGLGAQKLLADMVLANSEETRRALAENGYRNVELFPNPAPRSFAGNSTPPATLKRILSISNHVPGEMKAAFGLLEDRGFDVYRIGSGDNARRVQPYDLFEHDAVVTIGKSVQYALRAARPVYCYDHLQGPGWINRRFDENAASNFSGRCYRVRRSPEELADDIEAGYADARAWMMQRYQSASGRFDLEVHVSRIIEAAKSASPRASLSATDRWEDIHARLKLESTIYSHVDRAYEEQTGIPNHVVPKPLEERSVPEPIKMISLRDPGPEEALIVAAFSFRYDAHLVPALLENIGPSVHAYVCWDDRKAALGEAFSDETTRQNALFRAAQSIGADWIFAVDPDERFEDSLADKITDMTTKFGPVVWAFECREMFTPDAYRVDGIWAGRSRARLFPCLPGMEPDGRAFHGSWTRNGLNLPIRESGLNFYHLRMATSERRKLRRAQYAALDPARTYQKLGYDYLDDERGLSLRQVPDSRAFSPPYAEDHGLWAAHELYPEADNPAPDPVEPRFHRLMETRRRGGFEAALALAMDLHEKDPEDQEFALLAADCAMRANEWQIATRIASAVADSDPEALMALLFLTRSLNALGRMGEAEAALQRAEALAPGSFFCARERELMRPLPDRFAAPDALWRRWVKGPAEIYEGTQVATSDLTVVVLSMGGPEDLLTSVASLCEQSVVPEIVVVNSKGGDVLGRLSHFADMIRIVNVEERLYPGAARNVGIDASTGRFVAFLASDCTAIADSIERRLALHREGARAVSAFVIPEDETSLCQRVASMILHSTRHPNSGLAADKKYSLSYDRGLFEEVGYFPTGLRVGEDTYLNSQIAANSEIASDKGVCISHRYPDDVEALRQDMQARAGHRVNTPIFGGIRDAQGLRARVSNARDARLEVTRQILGMRQAEFDPETFQALEELIPVMLDAERQAAFRYGGQIVRAGQLVAEAEACSDSDPDQAEILLREAVTCQPQSPWLQLRLARRLMQKNDRESREEAVQLLRLATAISPGEPKFLKTLIEQQLDLGDETSARGAFESACLLSPARIDIWEAHAALRTAANRPLRVYSLQHMFFLNLLDTNVAATLAENHRRSGNSAARLARARSSGLELSDPAPVPVQDPLPASRPNWKPKPVGNRVPSPAPAFSGGLLARGRLALERTLTRKLRSFPVSKSTRFHE